MAKFETYDLGVRDPDQIVLNLRKLKSLEIRSRKGINPSLLEEAEASFGIYSNESELLKKIDERIRKTSLMLAQEISTLLDECFNDRRAKDQAFGYLKELDIEPSGERQVEQALQKYISDRFESAKSSSVGVKRDQRKDPQQNKRRKADVHHGLSQRIGYGISIQEETVLGDSFNRLCSEKEICSNSWENVQRLNGDILASGYSFVNRKGHRDGSGIQIVHFFSHENSLRALHFDFWKKSYASRKYILQTNYNNCGTELSLVEVPTNERIFKVSMLPEIPQDFESDDKHLKLFDTSSHQYNFTPTGIARGLIKTGDAEHPMQHVDPNLLSLLDIEHPEQNATDYGKFKPTSRFYSTPNGRENSFRWQHSLTRYKNPKNGFFENFLNSVIQEWSEDLTRVVFSGDLDRIVNSQDLDVSDMMDYTQFGSRVLYPCSKRSPKIYTQGFRGASRK